MNMGYFLWLDTEPVRIALAELHFHIAALPILFSLRGHGKLKAALETEMESRVQTL